MEVLIEVQVADSAAIYRQTKVAMAQPRLLGEPVIDFSSGQESSGLAPDGTSFLGERSGGLTEAVPMVLAKIDPVLNKATETLDNLQKTAANLSALTAEGSDLPKAMAEFRSVGNNLNEISAPGGTLRRSLGNIEALTGKEGKLWETLDNLTVLTGPEGRLATTLGNAERFTARLANNSDIEAMLRNFRRLSERLNGTVGQLGDQFAEVGSNLQDASDTVKRQPWRLIWPTTKKYDEKDRAPRLSAKRASEPAKEHGVQDPSGPR